MKKILVTGCAGFIGSHLTEKLLKMGYEVIGIDCFTDYYSVELKERNIENCLRDKKFKLVRADLTTANLREFISNVEYIFHLAAQPGVRASWGKNFGIYVKNNISATQKLLEVCLNSDIEKFVFTSSSSVYGDVNIPMREDSILRPISPYGVTKLAAENLCSLYWRNYGLPVISLRYFTVFGPRQRPDMAIAKFTKKIFNDETIQIYGDGSQTRDFTFVSDVVNATILAAKSGFKGKVFNISSGSRISVNELVNILEREIGKKAKVRYVERQKGDMKDTLADITKVKKLLNWRPRVSIEDGVKKYVNWFKKEIRSS